MQLFTHRALQKKKFDAFQNVFFSPAVLHNVFTPREQTYSAFTARTPPLTSGRTLSLYYEVNKGTKAYIQRGYNTKCQSLSSILLWFWTTKEIFVQPLNLWCHSPVKLQWELIRKDREKWFWQHPGQSFLRNATLLIVNYRSFGCIVSCPSLQFIANQSATGGVWCHNLYSVHYTMFRRDLYMLSK